ncbi:cytochrome P450, family 94, subfamily D, polypeptide 2 [Hibiscus trionum]|uniref:Cytochrome P450, family 94, subfamily D, polypeptide 2 n=1 Tax=Hibiscus trionum TaxID=183268 RepID=A0A9W7HC36_HIBTR|nr:cytochrome P450, family 94, subfamily D, polypeptide 2 [Hibiscus trionum]
MSYFDHPFLSLLCLLPLIFFTVFRRQKQAHRRNPAPQSYPIIGNLPGLIRNRHRFHDWVADMLSETPSSTLQVNSFLNLSHGVCTANPVNVHHLLVANFQNYVKGSRFRDHLHELLGHGIFGVDGDLWNVQRKISSHEFKTKSIKHFISDVVSSQLAHNLVPRLSTASDENRAVDLQEILQRFTFSNICKVAFGVEISSLDNVDSGFAFAKAFDDAVEFCSSRFFNPIPAVWKIQRLLNIGSEKRLKEAIRIVNDFALEIIKSKENEEQIEENRDLLSRFMSKTSSEMEFEDEETRRKFLRDIVISFVLAGKDSTSTALTWFFWLINGHPRCERLIVDELAELDSNFTYDDLKKLNYLHAALSESLRLFPPVPINSRITVDDDVWPDGTHVSKGWFSDYSAYAMGRMTTVWGPDCREFKPERWLDGGGGGVFKPSDQFKFPVFHCGPRTCLGKEMAFVQMKTIVVALMREFEIVAVDGGATAERMMNPPYTLSLLLKMRGGLQVRLKKRMGV